LQTPGRRILRDYKFYQKGNPLNIFMILNYLNKIYVQPVIFLHSYEARLFGAKMIFPKTSNRVPFYLCLLVLSHPKYTYLTNIYIKKVLENPNMFKLKCFKNGSTLIVDLFKWKLLRTWSFVNFNDPDTDPKKIISDPQH